MMRAAKFYIYRNLHKQCFSVKYRGKVIRHCDNLTAYNVSFKVSESGRQRCLQTKQKNVHAYVVCDSWNEHALSVDKRVSVTYNPYSGKTFVMADGNPIQGCYMAWLTNGKVYVQ